MHNLKTIRERRGISQTALADKLNVTQSAIAHWESGYCEPPITTIVRLTQILGCTLDDLLLEADNERPQSPNE